MVDGISVRHWLMVTVVVDDEDDAERMLIVDDCTGVQCVKSFVRISASYGCNHTEAIVVLSLNPAGVRVYTYSYLCM